MGSKVVFCVNWNRDLVILQNVLGANSEVMSNKKQNKTKQKQKTKYTSMDLTGTNSVCLFVCLFVCFEQFLIKFC